MTQQELATESGVPPGRVSDYERGKVDPTVDTFLKLLAACGCTIRLADIGDGEFANPYASSRKLRNVLSFTDAMAKSDAGRTVASHG